MEHVGIDLGKAQSQVSWLLETGELKRMRIQTTRERLTAVFGGRPRLKVLVEASTSSEWVAQHMEGLGHEVVVADPNYGPMYADRGRRAKNDRTDADALVGALAKGHYRAVHRVSDARRLERGVLNTREVLVQSRVSCVNNATNMLWQWGIKVPTGSTAGFVGRVKELEIPRELVKVIEPLLQVVKEMDRRILALDKQVAKAAKCDAVKQRLMTVPGVGPVTASAFVATLDTADRFSSAAEVSSYLGLVPRERSSSDVVWRGRITKLGPTRMRCLLVQAAWSILIHENEGTEALRAWALRLAARSSKARAVVGLARRLSRILYAMWRDGRPYESTRLRSATLAASQPA